MRVSAWLGRRLEVGVGRTVQPSSTWSNGLVPPFLQLHLVSSLSLVAFTDLFPQGLFCKEIFERGLMHTPNRLHCE